MNQGPGWSPDGGYFWVRGHEIFWEDGSIGDITTGKGVPCRVGIGAPPTIEDYSQWTDEHRARVVAETKARRANWKKAEVRAWRKGGLLRDSARAKITKEEWDAIQDSDEDYSPSV